MKKVFLTFALIGAVFTANAQFRIDKDYPTAGIRVVNDIPNASKNITVDFNTDKALTQVGGSAQKASTARGVYAKVYNELGAEVSPVDSKANNYGSNGNPIHISDVATILNFYTVADEPAYSSAHNFWKPVNAVFDIDPSDLTNQAFGVYPGIYKRIDYRFYFNFEGSQVKSDIEFDIMTFDAGNTGKTAKYKLMLSIGSDKTSIAEGDGKTPDYALADFYETGSGVVHVKLAEAFGADPSIFTNKKVYISLYTDGTGESIQHGKYDPVIAIDNFTVQLGLAEWLTPDAGAEANITKDNSAAPVKNISLETDGEMIFPLYLKAQGRVGQFKVTNDIESAAHDSKKYSFLPTLGVKAKDASGNYTIDVPYTHAPDELNAKGDWTKEMITIAKPETLGEIDDICVYLKYTKKETDTDGKLVSDKFEIDCGTRIWYQFFGQIDLSASPMSILGDYADGAVYAYVKSGKVYVDNLTSDADIYTISGQLVRKISAEDAKSGISLSSGVYLISVKGGISQKFAIN